MVIMNDLEWPMLSYYVDYYKKFKEVMQWIEKEALIKYCAKVNQSEIYVWLFDAFQNFNRQ